MIENCQNHSISRPLSIKFYVLLVVVFTIFSIEVNGQEYSIPATVNAVKEAPYSEIGESKVVKSEVGKYREIGNRRFDRIAYLFETKEVGDFIRLTLEYPDDKDRMCEIYLFTEAFIDYPTVLNAHGAGENSLGTSYITGHRHSKTQKMVKETFYFFVPRSKKFAIALMNSRSGAPAAISSLTLERVNINKNIPDWPSGSRLTNRRKLGIYWEDPVLVTNFGGSQPPSKDEFTEALDRQLSYMNRFGLNKVIYPVVWYQAALYQPSAEYEETVWYERPHPPEFDKMMARKYSESDIDFWPSIRNWTLPSLRKYMWPQEEIRADKIVGDYVNAVNSKGETHTRFRQWHLPPQMNALHPRVQSAVKNLIREIMGRIGTESSVKGVALFTSIHSTHGLGTIDQSYDDYTLNLFSKETGIPLPELNGPPETRFTQWYEWLKSEHWQRWINWRKDKLTQFYTEMAEMVASVKPEAKLNIMVFYPLATSGIKDVETYLNGIGLDLEALSQNDNIVITRMSKVNNYYNLIRQHDPASEIAKIRKRQEQLSFDAEWQKPFIGKAAGSAIQYAYLEAELSDSVKLQFPEDWRGVEPGWHVTHPRASGRNAAEYIVRTIALYDANFVAHGGFNLGPQGMEELLQPLAATYTSLPAVNFETLYNQDGIVLRSRTVDGKRWTYLVNTTAHTQKIKIRFTGTGGVTSLGLNPVTERISSSKIISVEMNSYDLRAWKSDPELIPSVEGR